ncbi:MAG: hypothetical protein V4459_02450 [Pseudomonadota bacterium]
MRILITTAALLIAGLPQVASAANGDIGCIESKLGANAMTRIGDGVIAAIDKGGNPNASLDADRTALIAARDACVRDNKWSVAASQAAMSYTQARAARIGVEKALKKESVDLTSLNFAYSALPVADRESLIAKMSPRALAAIRKVAGANAAMRRHVALYFAALAAFEFYPAEFAAA